VFAHVAATQSCHTLFVETVVGTRVASL